jgi:hypothetical protein
MTCGTDISSDVGEMFWFLEYWSGGHTSERPRAGAVSRIAAEMTIATNTNDRSNRIGRWLGVAHHTHLEARMKQSDTRASEPGEVTHRTELSKLRQVLEGVSRRSDQEYGEQAFCR